MKITICASLAFNTEVLALQKKLEAMGHEVRIPASAVKGKSKEWWMELFESDRESYHQQKQVMMHGHFKKVVWADAVLVCNFEKKGIPGYIGANTLMEMAVALYERKKMYLMEPVPDLSLRPEVEAMQPIILHGDVEKIV